MFFPHTSSILLFRNTRSSCYHVFISIVALTLILFLCMSNVYSAQATLSLNPNSESDLAGYKVYYGNSSGSYNFNVDAGNQRSYTISNLVEGEVYFFAATAYDFSGNESGYSNEVSYDVPTGSGSGNLAPDGTIDMPVGNQTINVGDSVNFTGTGTDPDYDILTYLWDFGDPEITDSTLEDPGFITFNTAGDFIVTFTVTDSLGLSDPTPTTRTITVVDVTTNNQLQITNLNVASGKAYQIVVDGLQNGARAYVDRKQHKYSAVPAALNGATYIKTANSDNKSKAASFLTFDVNQDVTVYVAHDDRITAKPSWLGTETTFDDIVISGNTFSIFASDYLAGTITLGNNQGGRKTNMYTVVIVGQ